MSESPIKHVSDTAFMVAAYRALETARPEPLFRDALAAKVAGEEGIRILANLPKQVFVGGWTVVIRTTVIDRFIHEAIDEEIDTVLNLGAGLDTRPYRMDLPASLHWIEVDYPGLIDLKEQRLAGEKPKCHLQRVKLDLADASTRRGFLKGVAANSKKILVLTEGVVPYLTEQQTGALADDLKAELAYHYWVVDYFSPAAYDYRKRPAFAKAMQNAPFRFEPADYFGFFKSHGWELGEIRYLPEEAEKLGRPFPMPILMRWWLKVVARFAPPERLKAMSRFAGFTLLERS